MRHLNGNRRGFGGGGVKGEDRERCVQQIILDPSDKTIFLMGEIFRFIAPPSSLLTKSESHTGRLNVKFVIRKCRHHFSNFHFPFFIDAMSCQSHLHISPQSFLLQKLYHSWRLERSHLGGGLQRKLHHMDEILLRWAHRWLLVADKMFIVLSESDGRKLRSVGFIAAAERAHHDH